MVQRLRSERDEARALGFVMLDPPPSVHQQAEQQFLLLGLQPGLQDQSAERDLLARVLLPGFRNRQPGSCAQASPLSP
jgi:hypothetical protein